MSDLTIYDVFQFVRDIAGIPYHECVDTGNVNLDEETPLKILCIYNWVHESEKMEDRHAVAYRDQHSDELLEKYDVPVEERE